MHTLYTHSLYEGLTSTTFTLITTTRSINQSKPVLSSRPFSRFDGLPTVTRVFRARLFWGVGVHGSSLLALVEHDPVRLYMDG